MCKVMKARRSGFTIAEVLVALSLFGALVAITLNVMNQQVRAFYNGSAESDAAQHLRFSMSILDKHMANVGAGVWAIQPQLIYADTNIVAFNADWMSNTPGDPFAVNVDTTMPMAFVNALTKARRFTLPTTTWAYPDTTYMELGSNSPAETVIFWFVQDLSTPDDDYILWRQVNDQTAEMVARHLLKPVTGSFFRFYRHVTPVSGSARMDTVPSAWLPLRHLSPIHGSNLDTLSVARVDSVRSVEVSFRVTDGQPAPRTRVYEMRRMVTLPNAGKEVKKTCGDEPILQSATNFLAKDTMDAGGTHSIFLRWNASVDEASGERDVVRYVLWKSTTPFTALIGDPYLSTAAGSATYEYRDGDVQPLTTYYFRLAAQDCTPSLSNLRSSLPVIIP